MTLPWEEDELDREKAEDRDETCYLATCNKPVAKYGDFCCELHRNQYWGCLGAEKKRRLTIEEMQDRLNQMANEKYLKKHPVKKQLSF